MAITEPIKLGDGTQILSSPEGYSVPCHCGASLTWFNEGNGNVANCSCGMSYYAIDEARVKIEL